MIVPKKRKGLSRHLILKIYVFIEFFRIQIEIVDPLNGCSAFQKEIIQNTSTRIFDVEIKRLNKLKSIQKEKKKKMERENKEAHIQWLTFSSLCKSLC